MAFTFHGQKYHATGKMNCCSVDGNCVTPADGDINADAVVCWREKMRVLRKSCVTLGRNYATLREVAWCTRGCKIWGFVLQRRGYEASREVTWLRRKTVKLLMMQGGRSWQPLGEGNNSHQSFRQAYICYFRDKCVVFARKDTRNCQEKVKKNIARIANAVQVTICLLVSTSVY